MCTRQGTIKKTPADAFTKIRSTGIRAVGLNEGDELVFCGLSSGDNTIVIATKNGQGIQFHESEVRPMGRQAAGVRGIRLREKDEVVGVVVVRPESNVLFATSQGYGKRVRVSDFRVAHRGGLGVRTIPTTARNGFVIGLVLVTDDSEVLLIDKNGKIIRLSSQEVRTMGRQAKGVRLVRMDKGQSLSSIVAFTDPSDDEKDGSTPPTTPPASQGDAPGGLDLSDELEELEGEEGDEGGDDVLDDDDAAADDEVEAQGSEDDDDLAYHSVSTADGLGRQRRLF